MADVVLDTNFLVALLDDRDSLSKRADELRGKLRTVGHTPVLLDVVVAEAVSVLARRSAERRVDPPELSAVIDRIREWVSRGEVAQVSQHIGRLLPSALDVIAESDGKLNFNDALLVLLQREAVIGAMATFDEDFGDVEGFESFV
jgi:predicted nucleic acid-binding protein